MLRKVAIAAGILSAAVAARVANDSPCRDLLTEVRESISEVSETPAR